jgi:hypothetical protein
VPVVQGREDAEIARQVDDVLEASDAVEDTPG